MCFQRARPQVYDTEGVTYRECVELALRLQDHRTGKSEEVVAAYGMSREEITALAEKEPIGCEGLTFLPYLAGERTPNWPHASGCLVGIRTGHLARPGLVYRAALEGVSFSIRNR